MKKSLFALLVIGVAMLAFRPAHSQQSGADNAFFTGPGTHGATLNGAPLLPGTTILAGETVVTGPGGQVVMAPTHGTGGIVELTSNSTSQVHSGGLVASSDQLEMKSGNALITGSVSVQTPQGQTFQPTSIGTRFAVNAGGTQSQMAVYTGAVNTFNNNATSVATRVVDAGSAINISLNGVGQAQIKNISVGSVVKPNTADATVTTQPSASQSQ